jgi:hypothetical protein
LKTITFVAYKRPAYTAEALRQLAECRGLEQFDLVLISIDPGNDEVVSVCREWAAGVPIEVRIEVNEEHLGVAGNPLRAYSTVMEELGSEFNLAVEDDALLTPDALELALWFFRRHAAKGRYAFLSLCDHYEYRGPGHNKGGVAENASLLAETSNLSSPFAWCFTAAEWPFLKRHWDTNTRSIGGWDWSIRFGMRIEGRVALAPVLSRCRNIGEKDGTHDTPETWAQIQAGMNHSDGSYLGDYEIVNPVSDAEARTLNPWMIPELARVFGGRG